MGDGIAEGSRMVSKALRGPLGGRRAEFVQCSPRGHTRPTGRHLRETYFSLV